MIRAMGRLRRPPGSRHALVSLGLALVLGACGSTTPPPSLGPTVSAPPSATTPSAEPTAPPTEEPSAEPTASPDLARRPFTVLVLGLDHDERTDVVMVVGVDPVEKRLAFVSIPRDTINVPLPDGTVFRNQKINGFYNHAERNAAKYPQGPARATADMVETVLGIEIDYYAMTTFQGFVNLTKAMGGVSINLPKAVVDPYYQITKTNVGVRFPAGKQTLDGDRALIFVRTRQGDNDFERQRRQQLFLLSAGNQLAGKPGLFDALIAAQRNLRTDFPIAEVPAILAAVGTVEAAKVQQAVLGPRTYASQGVCPCGYSLEPNLGAMRKLAATFFPWAVKP